MAKVAGCRTMPLLGALPWLVRDPVGVCSRAALANGGLVRVPLGPTGVYVVSDPDHVRQVLVTNAANYSKGRIMNGIRIAFGEGLFTSEGALWRRQRRLMQPSFQQSGMRLTSEVVTEVWQRRLDGWSGPVDLLEEFLHLDIAVILRVLFSSALPAGRADKLVRLADRVFAGMAGQLPAFFLPRWVPVPGRGAYQRAVRELDEEIRLLVAMHRDEHGGGELLQDLLAARDPDTGEPMSDRQIRDEIFTMFMAGYESTASTLAWTCHLLNEAPEVTHTLRAEVDRALAGRTPTINDLPELPYTARVIAEGLRLYPAFPMYFRAADGADRLGDHPIPAGAQLVLCPHATHRTPEHWPDPERFDPDRFEPGSVAIRHRAAYFPFGLGQRRCIGEPMALTIATLALVMLVQRFDLTPGTAPVTGRYAMTYQPRHGLVVTPAARESGDSSGRVADFVRPDRIPDSP
ncbi:cytochrome P450 [Pseudonocardia spinosispora]|uniref:cytochrome P450 n=1 Tax=Pseudonocardia spinosispora TaxID=103441 RepID=UPI00040C3B41|nr:cytochrome P450 [Pseudonocardia spinosispora]